MIDWARTVDWLDIPCHVKLGCVTFRSKEDQAKMEEAGGQVDSLLHFEGARRAIWAIAEVDLAGSVHPGAPHALHAVRSAHTGISWHPSSAILYSLSFECPP